MSADYFQLGEPVQGGDEKVSRQAGIDFSRQEPAPDPQPVLPIVQGDPEVVATRQTGNGVERFGDDGILYSDHPITEGTMFADGAFRGLGEAAQPPPAVLVADRPISRDADAGYPGYPGVVPGIPSALPPVVDVTQAAHAPMDREAIRRAAIAAGFVVSDAPAPPVAGTPSVPVVDVMAADAPAPGAGDPRDRGDTPPMVFTPENLPTVKKRPVVPVDASSQPKKSNKGGR